MFNGVPPEQQFHQFIASRTAALPLPLPLTLPLHVSPLPPPFSIHELHQQQQPSHQQQQLFQSHLLHTLQAQGRQPSAATTTTPTHEVEHKQEEVEEQERGVVAGGHLELDHHQRVRSASEIKDPWLKEEVLALLTIRSSMGNDFSDFIWGHVSRELGELGYKRTADKCKEKFEEVSKYCSNTSYGNYYRSFNELEALFQNQNLKVSLDENNNNMVRSNNEEAEKNIGVNVEENSANETLENPIMDNQQAAKRQKKKKRKKHDEKIEMLKEFSEFVGTVLVQQEEQHKKFLEHIEKREAERVAKEDAWRKKEMERMSQELEIRAKEQAVACERQVHIIELLKKVASSFPTQPKGTLIVHNNEDGNTLSKCPNSPTSPSNTLHLYKATTSNNLNAPSSSTKAALLPQNQLALIAQDNPQVPNSSTQQTPSLQNPTTSLMVTTQTNTDFTSPSAQIIALPNPNFTSNIEREDHGKRWPREEVNSLINLRCNLQNIGEDTKAPLWERISQGMLELGYRRSAKKCKEKWENINKYFRKTKDANKKRSLDSKTCPYFHQLNTLYNQGRLSSPSEGTAPVENQPSSPKIRSSETGGNGVGGSSSQQTDQATTMVHVDEGEKNTVQVSPLEFEY